MDTLSLFPGDGGRITLERRDDTGALVSLTSQKFTFDRHFKLAAESLKVTVKDIIRYVDEYKRLGTARFVVGSDEAIPAYFVRGIAESASTSRKFDTFLEALSYQPLPANPVIEWEGIEHCCALDLDFPQGQYPHGHALLCFALRLLPAPVKLWLSKSGGLRAIYLATPKLTAEDLAACAGLQCLHAFPSARVELLTRTRFPKGEVWEGTGEDATPGLNTFLGRVQESDFAAWLESKSLSPGERYPHDACPVNPHARATNNANPVCVYEDHIHCYICAADGICKGSKTPGHFTAAGLAGDRVTTLFKTCVDNLTHWEHAKYVVSNIVPSERLARNVYAAALRRAHGKNDPRVPLVFSGGTNLVRYDGHWGDCDGSPVVFRDSHPARLAGLASVMRVDEASGEVQALPERIEWLTHPGDITRYGYPAIIPVYGFRVSMNVDPPDHKVFTVLHSHSLRAATLAEKRPRYVEAESRMPLEQAWAELEKPFPGLPREVVRLFIAAKGCAECGAGIPPMIFLTGVTGAGKTSCVQIAAAICGDVTTSVVYSTNTERIRASLLSAKKKGTYALFDEYLKAARKDGRLDASSAMELLLNFTPDSESHILYVGPVALGSLPVCIWCDTGVPRDVHEHAQLARRLTHVRLLSRLDWEKPLRDTGIITPADLRVRGSLRLVQACNAILSDVIDTFFGTGAEPIFRDIAEKLGFNQLEASDLAQEKEALIKRFFQLVCQAPPLTGADAHRWCKPGYVLIDLNRDTELVECWRMLADGKDQLHSRIIEETDLRRVLGLRCPASLDLRCHGAKLAVRFVGGDYVNGGLELATEQPGIHGLGNAISSQPQESRGESISAPSDNSVALRGFFAGGSDANMDTGGAGAE